MINTIVNKIWWVTNILDELVSDGVLSRNEAYNLTNSLFFGERYDEIHPDLLHREDGDYWKITKGGD